MTTPIFPALAGQGWSVKKKPQFATIVAPHVSGREVRDAQYLNPIWNFELVFEGLDGTATGEYGGLGASSLQSLMGLFLQCQGQFGTFQYYDPTDYQVTGQQFGVGTGSATTFQLTRSLGSFSEAIAAPFVPTTFTALSIYGAPYPAMNIWANSVGAHSGLTATNLTLTGGATDPFGGTLATACAETATNGVHQGASGSIAVPAGATVRFSAYVKNSVGSQYVQLVVANGSNTVFADFDVVNNVVTHTGANGTGIYSGAYAAASSVGYSQISLLGSTGALPTSITCYVLGTNGNSSVGAFPTYAGSTSNVFEVAYPQVEVVLSTAPATPDTVISTLATLNYGQPSMTVAGTYVDPSTYTIANGLVTFATAPSVGAALAWTGYFGFLCRFGADDAEFEQFMSNLWRMDSLKFRSVRGQ